jgi:hypothetical protein
MFFLKTENRKVKQVPPGGLVPVAGEDIRESMFVAEILRTHI